MLLAIKRSARPGATGPVPYLISAGLVLLSFFARLALSPVIEEHSPLLPFIAAVVLAAGLYGLGPGLLAVFLSVALSTWAFILPGAPAGLSPDQITSIAIFLATSAAMLIFANHLRKARAKAETLELELMQAQTTAAMGTMASTLAHELNQPLTAASNYVAACGQLAALIQDEKQASLIQGLDQAEAQIQRAGSIIRNARALLHDVPMERKPSSLHRMLDRVIELIGATDVGGHVDFTVNIMPDADSVVVNRIQIEQVLLNLVRNACEATEGMKESAEVDLKATATKRGSLIEVRDNGPGIPRDRLPNLFTAARSSSTGGMGIGLSLCRTIVEAHNGAIWAQNNPEGGASFFVLLPERPPKESRRSSAKVRSARNPRKASRRLDRAPRRGGRG